MIENLEPTKVYANKEESVTYIIMDKINELVDAVNRINIYLERGVHSKPVGVETFAKLQMLRACLDDIEEEIRKGSI